MRTLTILLLVAAGATAAIAQPSRPITPPASRPPAAQPVAAAVDLNAPAQPGAPVPTPAGATREERERAMIAEICAAADAVAERYMNLPYCHIITNDPRKADALRERVAAMGSVAKLRREEEALAARIAKLEAQVGDLEARKSSLESAVVKQEESLRQAYNALVGLRADVEAAGGEGAP